MSILSSEVEALQAIRDYVKREPADKAYKIGMMDLVKTAGPWSGMTAEELILLLLRRLSPGFGAGAGSGAGAPSIPAAVTFTVKFGKVTETLTAVSTPSKSMYTDLIEKIEHRWPKLQEIDYEISYANATMDASLPATFEVMMEFFRTTQLDTCPLKVTSLCKGFTDFTIREAMQYLGVPEDIPVDDERFKPESLDVSGEAGLEHLVCEIQRRIPVFGPLHESGESTNREFISPVLLAAATLAKSVQLRAEYAVQGRRVAGPVDYIAIYKMHCILLTHCNIEGAIPQNLAQIAATSEMMSKKRKAQDDSQLICSVITTGEKYIFLQFESHPTKQVFKSNEYSVGLTQNNAQLKEQLKEVLQRILGMFLMQKKLVDEASRKQRRIKDKTASKLGM